MYKKLLNRILIFSCIVVLLMNPLKIKADTVPDSDAVDRYVKTYIDRNGLPGASVVIVKDGKIIHEKGYGHFAEGNALTENSLMRVGSASKSFTAFSVLQLVDEGKIRLDDTVAAHLPELTMNDVRFREITIRQLLSHTSGIPNPTIVPSAKSIEEGIRRLEGWKLMWNPGEKYNYSNPNYWVLARLVEVVSGLPFEDYLKQNIFIPLGMNETLSTINTSDEVEGLSQGFVTAFGTAFPWTELEQMYAGAGGVITTASDMGKWLSMHMNIGMNAEGERLISEALLDESYSAQPGSSRYGLGWSLSSPHVKPARISHSGALSTVQAQQDLVPSSGYAVAVILNCFTSTLEHSYEISSGIIQLTEGRLPEGKMPIPIIIDYVIGLLTILYILLGIRGILRSEKWAERRKNKPAWKYYLRLTPHIIPIIFIGWLFFIVPNLQNNSSTIKDAFGIWPAAMIFLSAVFLVGVTLTARRIYYRVRSERK